VLSGGPGIPDEYRFCSRATKVMRAGSSPSWHGDTRTVAYPSLLAGEHSPQLGRGAVRQRLSAEETSALVGVVTAIIGVGSALFARSQVTADPTP
jgi:hypothetical protein